MRLAYDRKLDNGMGMLHGGATATILDTAMGCAAGTVVPDDSTLLTLDLHVTYLSPVTPEVMPITATARVGHVSGGTVYVLGEVHAASGQLVAHAVGNFKVIARSQRATA
ncbi:PaaI family thioesterase (plasmid) [Sphingomonas sanguinis]|uniref:PaaI family thioesterase n=1 Tax=Sphingomonas sanguinis TaxID=33051 RepID=UPI001C562E80|nr:PaaI family thioesterase [Sphingomonas sanguinis]QXT38039.1 PaaI family thioesterase [Sphingomonas sanguinis]